MRLQEENLRQWQRLNIPKFLSRRREGVKVEVTLANMGSGKTLYSAGAYAATVCNDEAIASFKIGEIRKRFLSCNERLKNFAIIFVPSVSIIDSTVRDWGELGIKLIHCENIKLKSSSPFLLMGKYGVNGIVVSYQQVRTQGFLTTGEWIDNYLVRFIKRSPETKFHAILDECHTLSIDIRENSKKDDAILTSKFFLCNQHLFASLHLCSGTMVKKKSSNLEDLGRYTKRIPFVKYDDFGDVIPDTLYSADDAIAEETIVKTNILIHSIDKAVLTIDDIKYQLNDEDLEWYGKHFKPFIKETDPCYSRIKEIEKCFKVLYKSRDLWKPLLTFGEYWLSKVREKYQPAIGIIFCPDIATAIDVHKNLLGGERSILCIGKPDKELIEGCNYISSKQIGTFLEENQVDWIISCDALILGFDHPKAKVSIFLPRLEFLSLQKVAQGIGRVNRTIRSVPGIEAYTVTLNFAPVLDLIKKDAKFGIIDPELGTEGDRHTQEIISARKILPPPTPSDREFDEEIHQLSFADNADILNGENFIYSSDILKKLDEIEIRRYWSSWFDLIFQEETPKDKTPPHDSGIYVIKNAKTGESLFVEGVKNLNQRICSTKRIEENPWIMVEGYKNIYVKWYVSNDYEDLEQQTIAAVKPKYNPIKQHTQLRLVPEPIEEAV